MPKMVVLPSGVVTSALASRVGCRYKRRVNVIVSSCRVNHEFKKKTVRCG